MSETRRKYSREFKEEAVALVTEQGYSLTEAANSLGIRTNMLSKWKQKFEAEQSGEVLKSDERAELVKLRQENKRLKMEKEILKKASTFFAKELN
jgi:transposase